MSEFTQEVFDLRDKRLVETAQLLHHNRLQIERLKKENEELTRQLAEAGDLLKWDDGDVRFVAMPQPGRKRFKIKDEAIFRKAVKNADYWCTSVPDVARIKEAIERHPDMVEEWGENSLTKWHLWAEFTTTAPSIRITDSSTETKE